MFTAKEIMAIGVTWLITCEGKGEGATSTVGVGNYEGWNFNSGNYLFTTDTK